jgi:hypothetical protein
MLGVRDFGGEPGMVCAISLLAVGDAVKRLGKGLGFLGFFLGRLGGGMEIFGSDVHKGWVVLAVGRGPLQQIIRLTWTL